MIYYSIRDEDVERIMDLLINIYPEDPSRRRHLRINACKLKHSLQVMNSVLASTSLICYL